MRSRLVLLVLLLFLACPQTSYAASVVINEVMASPASGGADWIEIYNTTDSPVNLNGWTLNDNAASALKNLTETIGAHSFLTFDVSNRLGIPSDSVFLKDSSQSTIDSYSYNTDPGTDRTFGKIPDGGDWFVLFTSSKNASNNPSSPVPAPTSTPTPGNSPTPTPKPGTQISLSQMPSSINSDQSFSIGVSMSGFSQNTKYYLKGAFKKTSSSNYFGYTQVGSAWIKNADTYTNQFALTTDGGGNWSGNISFKPDPEDSGYSLSGDYLFKIGFYADPTVSWGNEYQIAINNQSVTNTPTPTPAVSPLTSPASSVAVKTVAIKSPTNQPTTKTLVPESILGTSISIEESPMPTETVAPENKPKTSVVSSLFKIGGGIIFILISGLFFSFRHKFKFHF